MNKIKIEFEESIKIDGKEIKELEFREPLGEDMESLIGIIASGGVSNTGKAITALAARCVTSYPLEEDTLRALPAKTYMKIVEAFYPFLPQM